MRNYPSCFLANTSWRFRNVGTLNSKGTVFITSKTHIARQLLYFWTLGFFNEAQHLGSRLRAFTGLAYAFLLYLGHLLTL